MAEGSGATGCPADPLFGGTEPAAGVAAATDPAPGPRGTLPPGLPAGAGDAAGEAAPADAAAVGFAAGG